MRVKQYLAKIKAAETAGASRGHVLDKKAAGRFIAHALVRKTNHEELSIH